jgi:hypothetical protein
MRIVDYKKAAGADDQNEDVTLTPQEVKAPAFEEPWPEECDAPEPAADEETEFNPLEEMKVISRSMAKSTADLTSPILRRVRSKASPSDREWFFALRRIFTEGRSR